MARYSLWAFALLVLFIPLTQTFAQSESSAIFLMIAPGARASGMGEANVAIADDATAGYWNPAGLAFLDGREITLMYAKWLPGLVDDISYNFVGYRQYIDGLGGVGGHLIYLDLGEQVRTGENSPDPLGIFQAFMLAVAGSYASDLSENTTIGINVKFVHQNLAPYGAGEEIGSGKSSAFAFDIGILSTEVLLDRLDLGVSISNIGPKVQFIDENQADPMPTNLKAGLALRLIEGEYNRLMVTYDVNKLLVAAYPARDLNKNGSIDPGTEEESHTDAFYEGVFTSWASDYEQGELGEGYKRKSIMDRISKNLRTVIHNVGIEYWYSDLVALRAGVFRDYFLRDSDGDIALMRTFGAGLRYGNYGFDFGYVDGPKGHPLTNTMRFSLNLAF